MKGGAGGATSARDRLRSGCPPPPSPPTERRRPRRRPELRRLVLLLPVDAGTGEPARSDAADHLERGGSRVGVDERDAGHPLVPLRLVQPDAVDLATSQNFMMSLSRVVIALVGAQQQRVLAVERQRPGVAPTAPLDAEPIEIGELGDPVVLQGRDDGAFRDAGSERSPDVCRE